MTQPNALRPEEVRSAEEGLLGLSRLTTTLALYPGEHPVIAEALGQVHGHLGDLLNARSEVCLKFIGGEVALDGQRLFTSKTPPLSLVAKLRARKVHSLTFLAGLEAGEIAALTRALNSKPSGDGAAEELATVLADLRLPHILADELAMARPGVEGLGGGIAGIDAEGVYLRALDAIQRFTQDAVAEQPADLEETVEVTECLVHEVLRDRGAMVALSCIKAHDEYTFAHSLHVSILCLALGDVCGLSRTELLELGTSAVLHDVGKALVPLQVLRKPGRLDPEEWAHITRHPVDGARILVEQAPAASQAPVVAFEHHLGVSRKGYPALRRTRDLCPYTFFVSIADVYDALTNYRPYRPAKAPSEALQIMQTDERTSLDPQLLEWFIHMLGIYPPGSSVRLTSGEGAIVCETRPVAPETPVVSLVTDRASQPLPEPVEADLAEEGAGGRRIAGVCPDLVEPGAANRVLADWVRQRTEARN